MSWGDVWGTSPGRDSVRCAEAFYAGESFSHGNVSTDGSYYVLWGVRIAERIKPEDMPEIVAAKLEGRVPFRPRRKLAFCWPVVCTNREAAIARNFRALGLMDVHEGHARMRDPMPPTIGGKEIKRNEWFTLEDLAARPVWTPEPKPVKPRRPERFVNLTMELFPL